MRSSADLPLGERPGGVHASARHIYLEEPNGPTGFWTRLGDLQPPALFVWGDEDPLVPPPPFARYVRDALPDARQIVLEQCGHVPQVEHPVDANALVHDFIGDVGHPGGAGRGADWACGAPIQGRFNGNGRERNGKPSPSQNGCA